MTINDDVARFSVTPAQFVDAVKRDAELGPIDWSVLPEESVRDRVSVPSGSLARVAMGPVDAPRVVLVPGMSGSKEDFTLMLPLFAAAGYRAESFDMAGQYESAGAGPERLRPPQKQYTHELFVDDLIAVLETGATPAHVLGYSFAGTVAALAAIRSPERFASLTLLSTPPRPGQALRGVKGIGGLSPYVPSRTLGRLVVAALKLNVHRAPKDRATFVTARFGLTRTSSVADILGLMQRTPDLADGLRGTGVPILVAVGAGDIFSSEDHRAFAERIGARLLSLNTGHSPCETTPHQLTAAMLELFATVRS